MIVGMTDHYDVVICDGFPCLVHAKSDAEVIAVRLDYQLDHGAGSLPYAPP